MPESSGTDTSHYVNFLYSLQHVLPCKLCRTNYAEWLKKTPVPTDKAGMIKWIIDIQNSIRKKNGKSTRSYKEVLEYYRSKGQNMASVVILAALAIGTYALRM